MEELIHHSARERFDTGALDWFEPGEPHAMPVQFDVAQAFDTCAYVLDRRDQVETVEPFEERFEFELDDGRGLLRLALALFARFGHDGAEIVDIVQVDVLHRVEPFVEVAGHAEVDQEHRAVTPLADDRLELLGAKDRTRRGERAYNYVGDFQIRLEAVEGDGSATKVTRERDGVVEGPARDKQRLDPEALETARREFRHLPRAHQHHGLVA